MSELMLFDGYEPMPIPKSQEPGLSADQKRTLRQAEGIRKGIHPLTKGPVHEFGDKFAKSTDAKDLAFRCGSCVFRVVYRYHDKSIPKCRIDDGKRDTRSAGTDVRAWWPACPDYSAGDQSLSPDAARSIPTPTNDQPTDEGMQG